MGTTFRFLALAIPVLVLALAVVWLPRSFFARVGDPVIEEAEALADPERMASDEAALDRELSSLGGTFPGHVGTAVRDVQTGMTLHFNGLEPFPQQSVTKLWVAMTALDQAEKGMLDLSDRVTIRREDLTVFYQPIRNIVRAQGSFTSDYGDLLDRALTQSDNSANDRLLRRIGGADAVQDFLDSHDLASIRFGTDERSKQSAIAGLQWVQAYSYRDAFFDARDLLPDEIRRRAFESYLADPVDGAPPVAIAEALARLTGDSLLPDVAARLMLSTLERTKSGPRRLKGGVPEGWTIAHKTGTGQFFDGEQSGYNDVGVLTSPEGNHYAVVVMIARTRAPVPDRMDLMQEVVRAVVRYDKALAAR